MAWLNYACSLACCVAFVTHKATMIGFEEALPLWMLSSYDAGGLEWNTVQIGKVQRTSGTPISYVL